MFYLKKTGFSSLLNIYFYSVVEISPMFSIHKLNQLVTWQIVMFNAKCHLYEITHFFNSSNTTKDRRQVLIILPTCWNSCSYNISFRNNSRFIRNALTKIMLFAIGWRNSRIFCDSFDEIRTLFCWWFIWLFGNFFAKTRYFSTISFYVRMP